MKSRENLVRLKQFQVNEKRRQLAQLEMMIAEFERKAHDNLALDHGENLVYIAPTRVNLNLTEERWPDIVFRKTREH